MERKLNFEKFDVVNLNTEQMRSLQGGEAGTTAVVNATKKLVTDSSLGCFLATTDYFFELLCNHFPRKMRTRKMAPRNVSSTAMANHTPRSP